MTENGTTPQNQELHVEISRQRAHGMNPELGKQRDSVVDEATDNILRATNPYSEGLERPMLQQDDFGLAA